MTRLHEQAATAANRNIIERPRLTRMLDETSARVILLLAPAGYGKTTLARQWIASRSHGWYQATPSATDVAALVLGLSRCLSDEHSKARCTTAEWLKITPEPQRNVEAAAELLSQCCLRSEKVVWLVIDDYHLLLSHESERLVQELVSQTDLRLLLTTRSRPDWITARDVLYGHVYELGQQALSMTDDEAASVLSDERSAFISYSYGWPAVLALAAIANTGPPPETDRLPSDLHDFFAEELFATLSDRDSGNLCRLALLPDLSPQLVRNLFGDAAEEVLAVGINSGFLVGRGRAVPELHPLLRRFLREKLALHDDRARDAVIGDALRVLLEAGRWEDAFDLAMRFDRLDVAFLEELLARSLSDLLEHGRIETVRRWCESGRATGLLSPLFELLEAETLFREGWHERAFIMAGRASTELQDSPLLAEALCLAGQSAHLADLPEDARQYFAEARHHAQTEADLQRALWGQFTTTVELGDAGAAEILQEFEGAGTASIDHLVRTQNGWLYLQMKTGSLLVALDGARPIFSLVQRARDPLIRVSFLNIYAGTLRLAGRYKASAEAISMAFEDIESYRLDFARPHLLLTKAAVHGAVGEFTQAHRALAEVDDLTSGTQDAYSALGSATSRCRLLLMEGAAADAAAATQKACRETLAPGQRAEYLASRALALDLLGDGEQASELLKRADNLCAEPESDILCEWVRVLMMLRRDEEVGRSMIYQAFAHTLELGLTDTVILGYRVDPRILEELARHETFRSELTVILEAAHDYSRASAVGIKLERPVSGPDTLTGREQEVFALICEGRNNKEIASVLFLSTATVKVHVRNILKKLGVRTRTEAAILGAKRSLAES
jgi:LuxR family transcriptional regulator, maltose regulon positive regulatory protein